MTLSRRSFVKSITTAAVGFPFAFPNIINARSPNEKLNIASIAVGGRGWSDVNGASQGHNLVAFCDVMTEVSSRKGGYVEAAKQWPKARRYGAQKFAFRANHLNDILFGVCRQQPPVRAEPQRF